MQIAAPKCGQANSQSYRSSLAKAEAKQKFPPVEKNPPKRLKLHIQETSAPAAAQRYNTRSRPLSEPEKLASAKKPRFEAPTCALGPLAKLEKVLLEDSQQTSSKPPEKAPKYSFAGPASQKHVIKIMKDLIHSPEHVQVEMASNITVSELCPRNDLNVTGLAVSADRHALRIMPTDVPMIDTGIMLPIVIDGDGNCLARVGSLIAFGTSQFHMDIRMRIAVEMILYKDMYLDDAYLSRSLPGKQRLSARAVAQFSDSYVYISANPYTCL